LSYWDSNLALRQQGSSGQETDLLTIAVISLKNTTF